MSAVFRVGDVFDRLAELEDGSVDVCITSPPFLALRSYLPADHPDKAKEIGSEPTPAAFVDVLLAVTAELRRVLAPHGSIAVELGDTYAGSGGAGGDYAENGLREGQQKFKQRSGWHRSGNEPAERYRNLGAADSGSPNGGTGWPLAKSKALIPELYRIALAYGINPLTGQPSPAGQWRVRNVVTWCLDGDTVVYARTPKGEGPARLLHLAQNFQPGQWELWDGQRWTPVLGWSDTEASDAIEIEFRNGERISATRNHEWPTQRGLVRTDELTVGDVVDSVTLPEPDRPPVDGLPDEDIGWLLGTFLADGSFDSRDRIQISGHINETAVRLPRLRRIAEAYDGTATAHHYDNTASIVVRSPILTAVIRRYLAGSSAHNKSLRAATWRRSNAFLDAILRGYLEGDGHWDAKNQRWRLGFTDNPWLARDLRVIAARLGYRCRIKRYPRVADPRGGQFAGTAPFYHRGEIRFEVRRDYAPTGQVVALRASRRRRFFDVGVEGEPHLFALGSGILTHNCRPNPPVGSLGDKWRPATSDVVVACVSSKRYWDDLATRTEYADGIPPVRPQNPALAASPTKGNTMVEGKMMHSNPHGAPLLDWWSITAGGYPGAHYAVWPSALVEPLVKAMAPPRVCRTCGEPSRRIVESLNETGATYRAKFNGERVPGTGDWGGSGFDPAVKVSSGWTDCRHDDWRPALVLDPFAGSGTTLSVATGHGHDAIGIDLDPRNADLALDRVGPLLLEVQS